MDKSKMYCISEEVVNKMLGYLGTRPYAEVASVIKGLLEGCKPFEESKKDNDEKVKKPKLKQVLSK